MIIRAATTNLALSAAALRITIENAAELREKLFEAARTTEAVILGETDIYGQRYTVDFELTKIVGKAPVRSGWIVLHSENIPRLTTCYVLKRRRDAEETN